MRITINFDEMQNLHETRSLFLSRKFDEAYEYSRSNNCEVFVEGYFYGSDITIVHQIEKGILPITKIPVGDAKYRVVYLISAYTIYP